MIKMIAVLEWYDGFGNDTVVVGICDSVENARKAFTKYNPNDEIHERRYEEIKINEEICFDYYDAEPLYPKKKRKKNRG